MGLPGQLILLCDTCAEFYGVLIRRSIISQPVDGLRDVLDLGRYHGLGVIEAEKGPISRPKKSSGISAGRAARSISSSSRKQTHCFAVMSAVFLAIELDGLHLS